MPHLTHAGRLAALLLLVGALPACAAQPRSTAIERLRAAEDERAANPQALAAIFNALRPGTEPAVMRVAIRAVGRLQRPAFVDSLAPFLSHVGRGLRIEAANAIAQSVQPGRDTVAISRARELLLARFPMSDAPEEQGAIARSLGRLPHESSAVAEAIAERLAEGVVPTDSTRICSRDVRQRPSPDSANPALMFGTLHGIYAVARRTRRLGCEATGLAHRALGYRPAATGDTAVWVRELAMLVLQASNQADTSVLQRAARDLDPRVRRLAMRVARDTPASLVQRLAGAGLADAAVMVRIDAVRGLALAPSAPACELARRAVRDANPLVRTEAIDAVAAACAANIAAPVLDSLVRLLPEDTLDTRGTWHAPARALVALARVAPPRAAAHFPHYQRHPVWQARAALAAAARTVADTALLLALLRDRDANVREETITLLAQLGPALRERAARTGLADSAYQVVLAAAQAAEQVPTIDVSTLAAPLARLTARRQETSRDPRRELLERIAQRGTVTDTAALRPYVTDFDTLIARRAAEVMTQWTARRVVPRARSGTLPAIADAMFSEGEPHLRVTLSSPSGGGTFLVRLFDGEAPATVARVARLAYAGYYDGRTFHRVVPNFVIQGGSPDANEYVGDGPYMRDELGLRSHTRGTLGISTRGRDTGDAQMFVNLVDNFRLDHDYTVFGEIVEGMDVVDRVQSGAVMRTVQVVARSRRP